MKSRMANAEDITVSLMNGKCIFTEYILFHSGCSSSQMCTRNSEDSETHGRRNYRSVKFHYKEIDKIYIVYSGDKLKKEYNEVILKKERL